MMPEENSSNAELKNCKHCRDITLERLAAPGGYLHAPSRSSLVRSAQKCGLCSLLFRKDRSRRNSQIFLALEPFSDDDPQMCLKIGHMKDPAAVSFGITAKRELSNTQSEASYNIATKWIDDCVENHSCSTHLSLSLKERDNMFPTRLLDVEAFGDADQDIRLVDHDGVFKRYTTLSYCWGNSRAFTTTSRSIRLRKTRIAFSTLPKTFQDAVDITRRLRVRYLWIDALAIIQDDKLDWQRESAKMGAVYSMSFLTIAADAGVDCNSGCFNLSSTSQELASENAPFELPSKTVTGEESHLFLWDPSRGTRRPTPPEIDGSPLAERGWCCQERILSPRILHYTTSQLFWECRQVLLAEDGLRPWSMWTGKSETVPGLAANLYGTTSDLHGLIRLLDIWYNNVVAQSYSRRKLTREEDKLTAISGIARAFFRHFRCEYIAGLWLDDLSFGLSWRRRGVVQKPSSYRSPTFSWASLDCIVEWPLRTESHKSSLKIEKIHVELESQDPFGRLSSCWLIITGHIRQAFIVCNKRISAGGYDLVWELKSTSSKLLGTAFMDEDDYQDVPKLVDCLILSEDEKAGQALILERLPSSDRYQRIGVAATHGYERDDGFFDQSAAQTITIF